MGFRRNVEKKWKQGVAPKKERPRNDRVKYKTCYARMLWCLEGENKILLRKLVQVGPVILPGDSGPSEGQGKGN